MCYAGANWEQLEDEYREEMARRRHANGYGKKLARHPDCNDDQHPGCEWCEGEQQCE